MEASQSYCYSLRGTSSARKMAEKGSGAVKISQKKPVTTSLAHILLRKAAGKGGRQHCRKPQPGPKGAVATVGIPGAA